MRRILLALMSLLPAWLTPLRAVESSKPNIIFILADDLGYTDLACQGSRYYETPAIDRMAAQGMRFTSGYACGPNCAPTRAALMSGQYGPRTGIYTVGSIDRFDWRSRPLRPVDNVEDLPLDKITIAQALKKAGYTTALFGKWHLGEDAKHHPSKRGFDDAIVSEGRHFDFATNPKTDHPAGQYLADFLTDKAVDFIRRNQGGPFFLCLHHFAVHVPLQAKENWIQRFQIKPPAGGQRNPTYAAMIASVDESVGRVLALLDELKLSDNTLVVFTSDNGGVGGYQREGIKGGSITDNAPLKGGKGMLYEGGIRVPYIFRWSGKIAAGTVCDEPINSVDLYPTLLELAGAKVAPGYVLDGTSYLNLLTGGARSKRPPLYWHFPGYLGAGDNTWRTTPVGVIRDGDWKLLEFFETGNLEIYHLKDHLGETNNLAAAQPAKLKELHDKLLAWRQQVGAPMPRPITATDAGQPGLPPQFRTWIALEPGTGVPAPPAPPALQATARAGNRIELSWQGDGRQADGWRIERKRADVGLWFHVKTTARDVTQYIDDAVNVVLPGKTYTYRVAAFNAGGLSPYSSEVTVTTPAVTVPSAPTHLKATAVSSTQINLTWTDTSDNEDGFKLECKAGNAAEWKPVMGRALANGTSFTDYGLEPGRTYVYRVRAFNTAGESAWSAEGTASTSASGAKSPPKSKGKST
jgi:arylsulfatase A-like enzyme